MEVTFYGVRCAIPAPGPETVRYGGNTSCVAVRSDAGKLLILDSGTGIIGLGKVLIGTEFGKGQGNAAILLSHAHWDHIQGFPFFGPIFVPGNRFTVFGQGKSSTMLEGVLEGQVNPHFSPLYTMKNLGATFGLVPVHGDADDGKLLFEDVQVSARPNPHGHGTCLAFRLEQITQSTADGGRGPVVAYAPDVGYPPEGPTDAVLQMYAGADLLIHDATYTPEDRARRMARGYGSFADAAMSAIRARVKRLALFHYDQDYTDDQVDDCWRRCRALLDENGGQQIELIAAREGLTIKL